jgi:hypothetical protein
LRGAAGGQDGVVPVDPALYRRHRFPAEIIGHAVWLYFRFKVSHRDVEELLAERGIQVSYEASRLWCRQFGPAGTGRQEGVSLSRADDRDHSQHSLR